jgi:hypothetical protein
MELFRQMDIEEIVKVQMHTPNLVNKIQNLAYGDRQHRPNLYTLKYRCLREDMIEIHKLVHRLHLKDSFAELKFLQTVLTCGNVDKFDVVQ